MSLLTRLVDGLARRGRAARAADNTRWVVLDVESSGLDARTDRLLAIAAIAVRREGRRLHIGPGVSFAAVRPLAARRRWLP